MRTQTDRDLDLAHGRIEELRAVIRDLTTTLKKRNAALACIARTTFSGSDSSEDYMRGNRDAHETCARIARAGLTGEQEAQK